MVADLDAQGWAVVPGLALDPDNAALLRLGRRLGQVSLNGYKPDAPDAEPEGVKRVEALSQPKLDPANEPVLSTTHRHFGLHTDDFFTAQPVRWVLMHCWQPDPTGGGRSLLADVRQIVPRLSAGALQRLQQPDFPGPAGWQPILQATARGWQVRFNHRDMVAFAACFGPALAPDQRAALDELDEVASVVASSLQLAPGDCLVVDNHRVLHGRTAFDAHSHRLLKRLRVNAPS